MLRKALIAVVLTVAAFAGYVAMQPDVYVLSRSAVISAPPETVFSHIEDFRKWDAWSPWAKRDPDSKATFSGEPKGRGSVFEWSGNSEVGVGRMTMMQARAPQGVIVKLDFTKPYEATSNVTFLLKSEAGGTRVTWSMSGRQSFIEKAFCTMMGGMERIVGPDYDKGLANLKAVAEGKRG